MSLPAAVTAESQSATEPAVARSEPPRFAWRGVVAVAVILPAILLGFDFRYGYLRDELYFRMLREHLSWGYFDQPPLAPLLAWLSTGLFGDTLWALRMPSALALGGFAVLLGLIARELGGGRVAQLLAALAGAAAPWPMGNAQSLVTNTFDLIFWAAVLLFAIRALRRGDSRWWLAAGAAGGLATYNKYLIVILAGALLVGLAVVGPRRALAERWLWLGIALGTGLAAPNLAYQLTHDLPQLTMAETLAADRGARFQVIFWPMQFGYMGLGLAAVWLVGWRRLWRDRALRAFAVAYPIGAVAVFLVGGRPDYVFGLMIPLFAAGCVAAEGWLRAVPRPGVARRRRLLLGSAVAFNMMVTLVFAMSVLPQRIVVDSPIPLINLQVRDSIGWPEFAGQMAAAYHALPPADQSRAVLLVGNYGEAGALHRYGPELGVPTDLVYSGHNELHRLGPPPASATVAVAVGDAGLPERLRAEAFASCVPTGEPIGNAAGLANAEHGRTIMICRDPTAPWSQLWPQFLHSHHYG